MLTVDKGLTGDWLASAWELEFGAGGAEIIEIGGVTLKGLIYNGMILVVHRAHHVSGRVVRVADELLLRLLHPLLLLARRCTVLGLAELHGGWVICGGTGLLAVGHLNAVWSRWFDSLGSNGELVAAIGSACPVELALFFLSANAESCQSWSPAVLCLKEWIGLIWVTTGPLLKWFTIIGFFVTFALQIQPLMKLSEAWIRATAPSRTP